MNFEFDELWICVSCVVISKYYLIALNCFDRSTITCILSEYSLTSLHVTIWTLILLILHSVGLKIVRFSFKACYIQYHSLLTWYSCPLNCECMLIFLVYSIKTFVFGVFARVFRMLRVHTRDCSSSLRVYTWACLCTWEYFSSSGNTLQLHSWAFMCRPFEYYLFMDTH